MVSVPQLWEVHIQGEVTGYDSGASYRAPVDRRVYVMAASDREAVDKAGEEINQERGRRELVPGTFRYTARPILDDELVAARLTTHDGRMGYHSTHPLAPVVLCDADKERFELRVVVVPKS